jgi:hypothetical protein
MEVLVQWTHNKPGSWESVDSSKWKDVAFRPEPDGSELTSKYLLKDDSDGYVYALNVQGVVFAGYDHYAVEDLLSGETQVTGWNNDLDDGYPKDCFHAWQWRFRPIKRDEKLGLAMNTDQSLQVFCQSGYLKKYLDEDRAKEALPWEKFSPPPPDLTRHGTIIEGAIAKAHTETRQIVGYENWTAEKVIPAQRSLGYYLIPDGTRTLYQTSTDLAVGFETADFEKALAATYGSSATLQTIHKGRFVGYTFTSASDFPAVGGAWPTGTYRAQLKVTTCASSFSYGFKYLQTALGGFCRATASLNAAWHSPQIEASFTGTGLKLATNQSMQDSTLTASDDRFAVALALYNNILCPSGAFVITVNHADAFIDGPWTAPPSGPSRRRSILFQNPGIGF